MPRLRPAPSRRLLASGLTTALTGALLLLLPPTPADAAPPTDGLVLNYDLTSGAGATVRDLSGNGRDGTLVGGPTYAGGALVLDGVDDHVRLPDDLMRGLDSITVSADVLVDPAQAGNYFIWGLGNPAVGSPASGSGYLLATGNRFRAAITNQWWNNEDSTGPSPDRALARGVWKTVTYTQTGGTGVLYEDGVEVARRANVRWTPGQIGGGTTTNNVLGESNYAADNSLRGQLRGFRVYDRALTAEQVRTLAPADAELVATDQAALSLGDLSAVTADLALPSAGSAYRSSITWASDHPAISAAGRVTRPAAGSADARVRLTATLTRGSAVATKTFTATVPALPSDRSRAQAVADALVVVDADGVRGNLTLPTTGADGATVSWASSQPAVVTPDGVVTRPAHDAAPAALSLTATVTVGSATVQRAFDVTVLPRPAPAPYAGYAFSYFTGNSIAGEKIYFAASRGNNALQWDELNNGQPELESTYGERGLRDPFLIRSPEGDKFFLIATDLSIGRNGNWDRAQRTGSRYLEVWESTDLVTWSEQRHVLVSPPTAGNTWAPEAYYDESIGAYVVFWASKLYAESDTAHTGNTYNRMIYVTTRDFRTFSEPQMWQDRNSSRIDSTVIKENGLYYRFTKDEGAGSTGCSDIIQEKSASLRAADLPGSNSWAFQQGCIGRTAGTSAVEGPSVFKANPGDTSGSRYYLFVDEYGGRGYIPLGTNDLENPNWRVPASFKLPASPRHGTVIPVTQAELTALRADLPTATPVRADATGLVASLPLRADAKDTSGHGYDATLLGGATPAGGALSLDGTDDHVDLPDNLMAGLGAITVSLDVKVASDQAGNYFIWGLGNTAGDQGSGYLFSTGNPTFRTSASLGNWSGEQTSTSGAALPREEWKTLTYTQDDAGVATLYLDGVRVGGQTGVTVKPGDIGNGLTAANFIGRSLYRGDGYLKGSVRDFYLYNRALSAAEVAGLAADQPPVAPETPTPPVLTPPVVTPPVVAPPVVTPPATTPVPTPGPTASVRVRGRAVVGSPVRLVLTMPDGTATLTVAGRKQKVKVSNGRAVVRVRFTRPGRQKVVVKTATTRTVRWVRVRR